MLMKLFAVSSQRIGPLCSIPELVFGNKAPTECQEVCLAMLQQRKAWAASLLLAWQESSWMTPGIAGRTTVLELPHPASYNSSWSLAQKPHGLINTLITAKFPGMLEKTSNEIWKFCVVLKSEALWSPGYHSLLSEKYGIIKNKI